MTTRSKRGLLDHYASKPVQQFVQLDGFCRVWRDDVMGPRRRRRRDHGEQHARADEHARRALAPPVVDP